jgi:transcriptional regulator GlxA family with amidase domain
MNKGSIMKQPEQTAADITEGVTAGSGASPTPDDAGQLIVLYLAKQFSLISFAAALEPLRMANRLAGKSLYRWQIAAGCGPTVSASNGVTLNVDISLDAEGGVPALLSQRPSLVIVLAGMEVERASSKAVISWLRELAVRGVRLAGFSTGAWILAEAGLLNGRKSTIHWENMPGFREKFPKTEVVQELFVRDGNYFTCAGGTACLDVMLHLIGLDHSDELCGAISQQCLLERIRLPTEQQRAPLNSLLAAPDSRLLKIIEIMRQHISEPIPIADLAVEISMSRRQVERLFRQHLGVTPSRYYLSLRLGHARQLLFQTDMPLIEVSIESGFISGSHFSKCYRTEFELAPTADRNRYRRASFLIDAG